MEKCDLQEASSAIKKPSLLKLQVNLSFSDFYRWPLTEGKSFASVSLDSFLECRTNFWAFGSGQQQTHEVDGKKENGAHRAKPSREKGRVEQLLYRIGNHWSTWWYRWSFLKKSICTSFSLHTHFTFIHHGISSSMIIFLKAFFSKTIIFIRC